MELSFTILSCGRDELLTPTFFPPYKREEGGCIETHKKIWRLVMNLKKMVAVGSLIFLLLAGVGYIVDNINQQRAVPNTFSEAIEEGLDNIILTIYFQPFAQTWGGQRSVE